LRQADGDSGATPLDVDEAAGLIPGHIATRGQLNEWEQRNITEAQRWALGRGRPDPLTIDGLRQLHERMFGRTWEWAGRFRTTDKSIGVPAPQVWTTLRDCVDDARYWTEHGTMGLREAAARFHHRLVQVHPFPNGNGRWARLATDVLLRRAGERPFAWGEEAGASARASYIAALRHADCGDFGPLFEFLGVDGA
jgi:Fic-DOC domain mobile mystery protein B